MKQFAVLLVCTLAVKAADEKVLKPDLPPSVRPIVDLARAATPEMFAEVILRLVESGKIPSHEQQIDLLGEAFAVSRGSKEPVRLIAIPATPPDTRARYRSKAGELDWDALSLQSRIVKDLLLIDRQKARELFDRIARPALDPRPCEDPFIADVSAYYEVAGAIAQSGFTASERKTEAHVQFLVSLLAGAKSPNELPPFIRAIRAVDLTPPQRQLLSSALAAKLQSIGQDYRPFAMSHADLADLVTLDALDAYNHAQLSTPRCQPDLPISGVDDPQPVSRGATFKADPYFQSEDAKQIGDTLTRLRNSSPASTDWRNQLADFLRDFAAWTPQGSNMDAFHQRATVFRALLEFVPKGDDRDRVMNLTVVFLQSSDAERQSPAEWLYQMRMLLDGARQDAPQMLAAFRASGDLGLALYADLENLR